MSNKEQENKLTRKFVAFLSQYEDKQSINAKGFGDVAQIKLFGDTNTGLKDKLDAMILGHVDPVTHLRNWVKGEVLALQSLISVTVVKSGMLNNRREKVKAIQDLQKDIDELNAGKFKVRGIFKNENEKKELASRIGMTRAEKQRELENYDALITFLTVYMGTSAIPAFKQQRVDAYLRAMINMSSQEVGNANNAMEYWANFQETIH